MAIRIKNEEGGTREDLFRTLIKAMLSSPPDGVLDENETVLPKLHKESG